MVSTRTREMGWVDEWEVSPKELKLVAKIGSGEFGDVFKAKWHGSFVSAQERQGQMAAVLLLCSSPQLQFAAARLPPSPTYIRSSAPIPAAAPPLARPAPRCSSALAAAMLPPVSFAATSSASPLERSQRAQVASFLYTPFLAAPMAALGALLPSIPVLIIFPTSTCIWPCAPITSTHLCHCPASPWHKSLKPFRLGPPVCMDPPVRSTRAHHN